MTRRTITLILTAVLASTVILLCSTTPHQDTLLTGIWKAVEIRDETASPCKNDSDKFILKFSNNGQFESFIKKSYCSWKYSGTFKLDSSKTIKFYNIKVKGCDSLTYDNMGFGFHILSLTADSLLVRYNFCCLKDTCNGTSGWVTFIKDK